MSISAERLLPVHLILVRHGQSIGNIIHDKSKQGDNSAFTDKFRKSHGSSWQLSDLGIQQARSAGHWLRNNEFTQFDQYSVSAYARALQTAAELGLPNAQWIEEFHLREREWAWLDNMPEHERWEKYPTEMPREHSEKFWWTTPNGESYASAALRIEAVLDNHRLHSPMNRAIIVCHIEIMEVFRTLLEGLSPHEFTAATENPAEKIHNGQILHYTREDAEGHLHSHMVRRRSICPWDLSRTDSRWRTIQRKTYSNEDLLALVEKIKFVND